MESIPFIKGRAKRLSEDMPRTQLAFKDLSIPEMTALARAATCIDELLWSIQSLQDLLGRYKLFHSKVGCPGPPECDCCKNEKLLMEYGPVWYSASCDNREQSEP